jgi:outer membrane protein OmpA-like peptidoglycan-associated protein
LSNRELAVKNILISIAAATVLAACASAPQRNDQLEQARAQVQTFSQDPLATQVATKELQSARSELQQAEAAFEKRQPVEEVNHLAYLAARHAEIGQARIAEARAREQIAQGEAERNRVLLEARTREAERATQEARAAQSEAQMQAQQASTAREEALAARTEAESARATAETMTQQLAALQAEQTKRGMVMTLSDVLFDTGGATLKPGADLALNRLADFLEQNPDTQIIVEGHTDSVGSDSYNEDLSRRRGQAVLDALASRGVAANRVQVVGRGEAYPVAGNDTPAGRQQNRRVEIIFSDEAGRFAQGVNDATLR